MASNPPAYNKSKLTSQSLQFSKWTSDTDNIFEDDHKLHGDGSTTIYIDAEDIGGTNRFADVGEGEAAKGQGLMGIYPFWKGVNSNVDTNTLVIDAGSDNNKIKLRGTLDGIDLDNIKSLNNVQIWAGKDAEETLQASRVLNLFGSGAEGSAGVTIEVNAGHIELQDVTKVTDDTDASSSTAAALVVTGGVGIAKKLHTASDVTFEKDSVVLTLGGVGETKAVTLTHSDVAANASSGAGTVTLAGNLVISETSEVSDKIIFGADANYCLFKDSSTVTLKSSGNVKLQTGSGGTALLDANEVRLDTSTIRVGENGADCIIKTVNDADLIAISDDAAATVTFGSGSSVVMPSATITTATINGGNINGTTIGATTPAAGTFTGLTVGGEGEEFTITESGDNITIKNTKSGKDILFNVSVSGTDTEIMRLDGSASSLLMADTNKIEFGEATNYIAKDGTALDIASDGVLKLNVGTGANPGELNLGTVANHWLQKDGNQIRFRSGSSLFIASSESNVIDLNATANTGIIKFKTGGETQLTVTNSALTSTVGYSGTTVSGTTLTGSTSLVAGDSNTLTITGTGITNTTGTIDFSDDHLKTTGKITINADGSAADAAGSLNLGAGNDLALYHTGEASNIVNATGDLTISTTDANGGIILDSENDTVVIKYSGSTGATFNTSGLTLAEDNDVFVINTATVLSRTALGSTVVSSSLTSVDALNSGSISTGFGNIDNGTSNITSGGIWTIDADASEAGVAGSLNLGAEGDLALYHTGEASNIVNATGNLIISTTGDNAEGIVLDSKNSTVEIKLANTLSATFNGDGLNLVSSDVFKINNATVLSAEALGSEVVSSSLTSVAALDSGSITSGFGAINNGESGITTEGTLSGQTLSVGGNATVTGNLTVNGTTTQINVSTVTIDDHILYIGDAERTAETSIDYGFVFTRKAHGAEQDVYSHNVSMIWDESADEFAFCETSSNDGSAELTIASYSNLRVNQINIGEASLEIGETSIKNTGSGANLSIGAGYVSNTEAYTGTVSVKNILNIEDHGTTDKGLKLAGTILTSSAEDLNTLSGITAGTAEANKALVLDDQKGISSITSLSATTLTGTNLVGTLTTASASQPNVTTMAGLTTIGSSGAVTNIAAGDLTIYNPVNGGNPSLSIGSAEAERLSITTTYNGGEQTLDSVKFATATAGTGANKGKMVFDVDGTEIVEINDSGISMVNSKTITGNLTGDVTGNADTATALETERTISLSGDVSGTVTFDGTGNADIVTTIQANSVALGTDTTGNYVATVQVSGTEAGGLSVSGSGSETAAITISSNATSNNTNSAVVMRDGSGNFSAGTITAALSGNASTATALQTARTLGGVSFDGTANINLPGVNATGNQDTSGNAATATALETARTLGGVSFDGTANINLPGVNTSGNQDTSGNAATASQLLTARTIGGVSFDGTANIVPNTVNIADEESENADRLICFADAEGTQQIKNDGDLKYNPSTGTTTATNLTATSTVTAATLNVTANGEIGGNLDVTGDLEVSGEITCSSDATMKKNIRNIENPEDKLEQLNGVSFEWAVGAFEGKSTYGIIAQDVEEVLPEAVTGPDGMKRVNYNCVVGLLVEALKEQAERIRNLESILEIERE